MTSYRWRLPDAPLRTSVTVATGIALLFAAGSAWLVSSWIDAGALYPLKVVTAFAAFIGIVLGFAGEHHPFPRFGPANHITMIRSMLAAHVAALGGAPESAAAAWLVVGSGALMAALDGMDGWLARRTRMASAFGARFDMETDALFILVLSLLVWQHGKAGPWVVICGMMRYAFVAAGKVLPWLAGPLRSTNRGKTVAIGQTIGLSVALAPIVPVPASALVAAVVLAALVWSFSLDVVWLSRRYRAA